MQFQTQLRRARITYAILMASCTCTVMSAVSTYLLAPDGQFWHEWPHVLMIDMAIANPVAIILGPFIRRLCLRLYPNLKR